jgi:hypothetical protein
MSYGLTGVDSQGSRETFTFKLSETIAHKTASKANPRNLSTIFLRAELLLFVLISFLGEIWRGAHASSCAHHIKIVEHAALQYGTSSSGCRKLIK